MSDKLTTLCLHCGQPNQLTHTDIAEGKTCSSCHKSLLSNKVIVLTDDDLRQVVKRDQLPWIVDFWAPWCGPCKVMGPILERLARQPPGLLRIGKLNTDDYQKAAGAHKIRGLPTLILFHRGREVARTAGAMQAQEFKRWIAQHLPK